MNREEPDRRGVSQVASMAHPTRHVRPAPAHIRHRRQPQRNATYAMTEAASARDRVHVAQRLRVPQRRTAESYTNYLPFNPMGVWISKLFDAINGGKECRVIMLGLDAAGKTTM